MKINFETNNMRFGDVISVGKKYEVPKYQRDYAWGQEQWEDLWQDICDIRDTKDEDRAPHYMGYLVVQQDSVNKFKVIDGQQRLTTLSILIIAILKTLNESADESDQDRSKIIKSRFICTTSASSLTKSYRLKLNRNNDGYYQDDLASLSKNPGKRYLKKTERQMLEAQNFYLKKLESLSLTGSDLAELAEDTIANFLVFTVLIVGDDANAYKIFETLNARGVQLSTPDLVKNFLFSILDPKYQNKTLIDQKEGIWSSILDQLKNEEFSQFLRAFWNSKYPLVTKKALFKKIRIEIDSPKKAIALLDELKIASEIYAALKNHDDEFWKNESNSTYKKNITDCLELLKIFGIKQPYPILLRAYLQYSDKNNKKFSEVCSYMTTFCIRYHVICNLSPNDVEKHYNAVGLMIHQNKTGFDVKHELFKKMPNDEIFKKAFSTKNFPSSQKFKKPKYLLVQIEKFISKKNFLQLHSDITAEHILPKNAAPNDNYWHKQFGDLLEQSTERLGNITLLTEKNNTEIDRLSFPKKKTVYERSPLTIVEKICTYDDWNVDSLNDYQQWLTEKAVELWSL